MADYKKMYCVVCSAADSVIDELDGMTETRHIADVLKAALLEAEEIYINTSADDE